MSIATEQICVLVPTVFKNEDWLKLTLESIRSQSRRVHIRIVGPYSDALSGLAAIYGAEFVVETGRSLSEALNQGFEDLPRSVRYVSWIGDDDLLSPGSIDRAFEALELHPDAPFAFGRVRYIDGLGRTKWLIRPGAWAVSYARWGHNFIAQQGSLIRLASFGEVKGIDNTLRNSMDQDLFLKLSRIGRPRYIPSEQGAWRIHDASISSTKGGADEWRMVMRRYRPMVPRPIDMLATVFFRITDRILLSVHCRIPGPGAAGVNGISYISTIHPDKLS